MSADREPDQLARWRRRRQRAAIWIRRHIEDFDPPEVEVADHGDLIEGCRRGWSIAPFDGDMPQPSSEDSYEKFVRERFPNLWHSHEILEARYRRRLDRGRRKQADRVAAAQAEW